MFQIKLGKKNIPKINSYIYGLLCTCLLYVQHIGNFLCGQGFGTPVKSKTCFIIYVCSRTIVSPMLSMVIYFDFLKYLLWFHEKKFNVFLSYIKSLTTKKGKILSNVSYMDGVNIDIQTMFTIPLKIHTNKVPIPINSPQKLYILLSFFVLDIFVYILNDGVFFPRRL